MLWSKVLPSTANGTSLIYFTIFIRSLSFLVGKQKTLPGLAVSESSFFSSEKISTPNNYSIQKSQ